MVLQDLGDCNPRKRQRISIDRLGGTCWKCILDFLYSENVFLGIALLQVNRRIREFVLRRVDINKISLRELSFLHSNRHEILNDMQYGNNKKISALTMKRLTIYRKIQRYNLRVEGLDKDEELVEYKSLIQFDGFVQASMDLKNNLEFVKRLLRKSPNPFQFASLLVRSDKNVALLAVRKNGLNLKYCSSRLQQDKEVVLKAISNNGMSIQYAAKHLRDDIDVICTAFENCPDMIQFLDKEFLKNADLHKLLVSQGHFDVLRHCLPYVADRRVFQSTLKARGALLKFCPDWVKEDRELVLIAVISSPSAILIASTSLQSDIRIAIAAVRRDASILAHLSSTVQNSKQVVLEAVKRRGHVLQFASKACQNEKKIVMTAINQDPYSFSYASESLRGDKEVVLLAVSKLGFFSLEKASEELRNDEDCIACAKKRIADSPNRP